MAPLCAEFGISRKTSYKIFDRYKDCGLEALTDRSRRPFRQANRLPAPIEAMIVRLKREYPGWGAPKIREKLRQSVRVGLPIGQNPPARQPCRGKLLSTCPADSAIAREASPGSRIDPASVQVPFKFCTILRLTRNYSRSRIRNDPRSATPRTAYPGAILSKRE